MSGIGFGALAQVKEAPRHWRLLLLWCGGLLLPTTMVAFPLWRTLGEQLDHSVHAAEWAQRFDILAFGDVLANTTRTGFTMEHSFLLGLLFTLLLSPLLAGMVLATIRVQRSLGFVALFQGGFTEYGRMFRMLLWAAVPMGVAAGLGANLFRWAQQRADLAILESEAEFNTRLAWLGMGLLLLLAHATIEAGRVQLAIDGQLRSVIRAWWRGTRLLLKRPVVTLGLYLVITLLGFGLAALLGVLRIRMPHASGLGFLGGFLVTQLIAMTTAWTRCARLLALAEVARPSD